METPVAAFDPGAVAIAIVIAATVMTSAAIVWRGVRKFTGFTDLLNRELTGWVDPATGEQHPSLRAELRDLSTRITTVEHATNQLKPNGGTHLYDAIRRIENAVNEHDARVERLEAAVDAALKKTTPKPRTRKTTPTKRKAITNDAE